MRGEIIMVCTIPKYTQYQLSQMVKEELKKENLSIIEFSTKNDVNQKLLKDILHQQVKFKASHYEVISILLGISIDELLEDEVIKPISFRNNHKGNNQDINQEIKKISNFFVEVAFLKKNKRWNLYK